jgi:hypothetical protein
MLGEERIRPLKNPPEFIMTDLIAGSRRRRKNQEKDQMGLDHRVGQRMPRSGKGI